MSVLVYAGGAPTQKPPASHLSSVLATCSRQVDEKPPTWEQRGGEGDWDVARRKKGDGLVKGRAVVGD